MKLTEKDLHLIDGIYLSLGGFVPKETIIKQVGMGTLLTLVECGLWKVKFNLPYLFGYSFLKKVFI